MCQYPTAKWYSQKEKLAFAKSSPHPYVSIQCSKNIFWGEAILTTTFLINRMPSRVHNRLVSNIPLRVFGCTSFVHFHSQNKPKLDPRALKTIFLGYSPTQKGYKCYDPLTRKMYVSYDVSFFENQLYFSKTSIQGENLMESCFWKLFLILFHL